MIHSSSDGLEEYHGVDSGVASGVAASPAVAGVVVVVGVGLVVLVGFGMVPLRYFSTLRILAVVKIQRLQEDQFVPSNFCASGKTGGVWVCEAIVVDVCNVS
jgi:hypothetical protein